MHPVRMNRREHILDVSHGVIWPDGYAAFDQGGHAPPPAAYAAFARAHLNTSIVFRNLFDRSVMDRLKRLSGFRGVLFKMRNSAATQQQINAEEMGAIGGLLSELLGWRGEVVVSASVHVSPHGRGARSRTLRNVSPDEVIRAAEQADRLFDAFVVSGFTSDGELDTVDVLISHLCLETELPRASRDGHFPDTDATIAELIRARAAMEEDGRLEAAVTAES